MIALVSLLVQTPELRRTMAAGPTEAVLIGPPQAVGAVGVRRMTWTADGGYLVVVREPDPAHGSSIAELVVWGRRNGKARVVFSYDPASTKVNDLLPMGGSDRFVLDATQKVREGDAFVDYKRISLVSASSGNSVQLSLQKVEKGGPLIDAYPSPLRPIAILERIDDKEKRLRIFGPDGRLGSEIVVTRTDGFDYDTEGYPRQIRRTEDAKTGKGRTEARRIDFATGRAAEWLPWTYRQEVAKEEPIRVSSVTVGLLKGVRAPGILIALKDGKDDESGVVSTDGEKPMLSPKNDAIAYLDQGLAMVRTLEKIDRTAYDEALRAQRIAEAVQRAKQIGVGLLQLAASSNDVLPGQGVNVNALISPYLKNDSLLQGFTYTFGGGNQAEIEDVSGTELGYVSGPGGRAMIYADGHTKWVPDP